MYGMYFSAALICAAALLVGRAVLAWAGRDSWSWLEPSVGLAALLGVAGLLARVPGEATTALIGVALLLAASIAALRRGYRIGPEFYAAIPVALLTLVALSIPFLVNGRYGLLGVGFNNDFGLHLAWSEWLRSGFGPEPEAGYPLGPHALAAIVAAVPRIDLDQAFSGLILAISLITALTALAALRELGPVRRTIAATLVAITYLAASYFAQAAFKETAEALFVLAFAIALPTIFPLPPGRGERARALAPLGVLAAGIVFSYSFAGLAWPIGLAILWSLTLPQVRGALSPRRLRGLVARRASIAVLLAIGAGVAFLGFVGPFGFAGTFGKVAATDTYGAVSPAEALGFWPAANYRLDAAGGAPLAGLTTAIAIVALLAGLAWWVRRGELAVPAALLAGVLLYLVSLPFSGEYAQAKALMIVAPVAMLIAARALLSAPAPGWRVPTAAWTGLAVAFLAGAAYSSFLVLREAPVAPPGHASELAQFREAVAGKKVLYAGQDRFAAFRLLGADTSVPIIEFPDDRIAERPSKPWDTGIAYSPIDFDSFEYSTLNEFNWVVTTRAAFASQAPSQFDEYAQTDSYTLWKQIEAVPSGRRTLPEGGNAAEYVNCEQPEARIFVRVPGTATVIPTPLIGPKEGWDGGAVLGAGDQTSQTLQLPAGEYRLSIQYFSPFELTLEAEGFTQKLIPALDGQRPVTISLENDGQYWPAGHLTLSEPASLRFTLKAAEPTTLQELTGYDGKAYIGDLIASPDGPFEKLPLSEVCDRWVDWFRARDLALYPRNTPPAPDTAAPGNDPDTAAPAPQPDTAAPANK